MATRRLASKTRPKAKTAIVAVQLNASQMEMLERLGGVWGDTVEERVGHIVMVWLGERSLMEGVP